MSLMNDMLRDLDARGSNESQQEAVAPAPRPARRYWPVILPGIALIALAALAYGWLAKPDEPPLVASVTPVVAAKPAANPIKPAAAKMPVPEESQQTSSSVAAKAATPMVVPVAQSVAHSSAPANNAIQQLLAAAEQALAADRLTRPPVNNAYALYQHILLLEPDNKQAKQGITRIHQRYAALTRQAMNRGGWNTAENYIERAASTGAQVAALRAALVQARAPAAPLQTQTQTQAQAQAQTTPAPPDDAMSLSWPSREAAAVTRANRLLQQNRTAEAIHTLETLLAAYPQGEDAAMRLFDIHLQTGDRAAARTLRQQTPGVPLKRYFKARLLAAQGQSRTALKLLEQYQPVASLREPHLALQAALYQGAAQYQQAQNLYQHLVKLNKRQPTYWLGLGVTAQALGQSRRALRAFRAAQQLAPANPAVSRYIAQRIEALSQ